MAKLDVRSEISGARGALLIRKQANLIVAAANDQSVATGRNYCAFESAFVWSGVSILLSSGWESQQDYEKKTHECDEAGLHVPPKFAAGPLTGTSTRTLAVGSG